MKKSTKILILAITATALAVFFSFLNQTDLTIAFGMLAGLFWFSYISLLMLE